MNEKDWIESPLAEILIYLHSYDDNALENKKFVMLCKNLRTHFNKLFLATHWIITHTERNANLSNEPILRAQFIEYCFIKLSTIWDLSYQIGSILLNQKSKKKYEELEAKFAEHKEKYDFLGLGWYKEINFIRNRIVHGGINIMPFYESERLAFNSYNIDVNSIMSNCSIYSRPDGLVMYADNYFCHYTGIIYNYLLDFFDYVLQELKKSTIPTKDISHQEKTFILESHEKWGLGEELTQFNEYAYKIFSIPLTEQRSQYVVERLNIPRTNAEPGSIDFARDMVESILSKYGLTYEWASDKNSLRIPIDENGIKYHEQARIEMMMGHYGPWTIEPSSDKKFWTMTFNFRVIPTGIVLC
ncbi:hypothetical protein AT959_15065 [Dechloromonas denitrificans]|uniref:Uncharacterized protein n=1 Tax=Dechloromonas denitrificans TaxID=281362 RepID=A0A133XEE1_9RHOO|nr:hypothetical protein [Dechloromonas denitrificans]KXB29291.1 hypothetical protein AT959_15065 [Dechloromonas denitrificans]